jgi:hypothetical protein
MSINNYAIFLSQLLSVTEKYNSLIIKEENGHKYLKGILDIKNDDNINVGAFLIELHYVNSFPKRFPKLKEVGGDIPNIGDWHKYPDESCCITVEPDEIIKCKQGITLLSFIEQYAIPYFANQIYKKNFNRYLNGEYAHNADGLKQFYTELFRTTNTLKWFEYWEYAFKIKVLNYPRNRLCFCGSNKKFKHCHDIVFYKARIIGSNQILSDFKKMNL